MIPFAFRLRKGVTLEKRLDSYIAFSKIPLNLIRISERAATVLELCDGVRTVEEIAAGAAMGDEEKTFKICRYFSEKGLLEMEPVLPNKMDEPTVSIIIPVRNRQEELKGCLESVFSQDYPSQKMEVIVIDDGSTDGTAHVAASFPCRILANQTSRGQSRCRNMGAQEAKGQILAFIDSDCVADNGWLKELVPYFQWRRLAAVGGYVDGFYHETPLDRYEETCSPLNMGKQILYSTKDSSTFYMPSCNLLVQREAYRAVEGMKEDMHVGEDVDLCWRFRDRGYDIAFIPRGIVHHKHRNELGKMLRRRSDYGASEAVLHALHPEKKKNMRIPPLSLGIFLCVVGALILSSPLPLYGSACFFLLGTLTKVRRVGGLCLPISLWKIALSATRSHLSFIYHLSFRLMRYYLIALLLLGCVHFPVLILTVFMLLFVSSVDYALKRPHLNFAYFLFYYTTDHLAYQTGVILGHLQQITLRLYRPEILLKVSGLCFRHHREVKP